MAEPDEPANPSPARPPAPSCLTLPSFSEACGLISSKYSCLVVRSHRRHLALAPKYLHKKRSGIQESLSGQLLKYSVTLEGVPVAYDNIKLVGELGDIQDDIGYIHINIEADFVIFQPKCGQRLVGVVNKKAPSHIGCLVHGCFNASIPRPPMVSVDVWEQIEVNIGDQMEFVVFRLDSDAVGVLCIRGKLDRKLEAEAIKKLNAVSKEENANVVPDEEQNGSETSVDETKKKLKRAAEESLSQNECIENQEDANLSLEKTPKKKKVKRKHREDLSEDHYVEVDGSGDNSATKTSSKHRRVLQNANNSEEIDNGADGLPDISVVSSSQERKTKKSKKHNDRHDLDNSLQNFFETSILPEKISKKRKRAAEESLSQNECIENQEDTNLSLEETPKKKKVKRRHREDLSEDHYVEVNGSGDNSAMKTSSKHRRVLQNTDNSEEIDNGADGLYDILVASSSQECKTKKSKKKKHKGQHDLDNSLQNRIIEDSLSAGDSTLEGLGTEPGTTKKKDKTKHKNASLIMDQDSANDIPSASSLETSTDNFGIPQEAPKVKKHKKKRLEPC